MSKYLLLNIRFSIQRICLVGLIYFYGGQDNSIECMSAFGGRVEREIRELGSENTPMEMLVELGIYHVTQRFIQSVCKTFGDNFPLEQIIEMRINGINLKAYQDFWEQEIHIDKG